MGLLFFFSPVHQAREEELLFPQVPETCCNKTIYLSWMSEDRSEIKTRIKIPKEKKTTNQSPTTLANSAKGKTCKKMLSFDHQCVSFE
jgi:hypothetical protein